MPFSVSRSSARRAWAPLLASLFLLATCDLQDPVAPHGGGEQTPGASRGPLADVAADGATTPSDTFYIASPTVDAGESDQIPWTPTGLSLPDSSWVSIRISAPIALSPHPRASYYPGCGDNPACFPWAGDTLGPAGRTGRFLTSPGLSPSGSTQLPTRSALFWIPLNETEIEYLLYIKEGAQQVWLKRAPGPQLSCSSGAQCIGPAPDYASSVPVYAAEGTYAVTAAPIPMPVQLPLTREPLKTDSTTTVDLAVQSPYRLIDGSGNPAAITWTFLHGDTTEVPGAVWNRPSLLPCTGQTSCTFKFRESGRVRVNTHIEGIAVRAYTEVVRARDYAALSLSCTPSPVTRGEPVSCTASTQPAGGKLEQVGWMFEADADDFAVLGPDTTRWEGPLVVSGTVTLHAVVDGKAQEKSARVEVRERAWAPITIGHVEEQVEIRTEKKMRPYPYAGYEFGVHDLLKPDLLTPPVAPVATGPNTGLRYLLAPLELPGARVSLHPALGATGAQEANTPWASWYLDQNNVGNRCDSGGVTKFRSHVAQHAGVGSVASSHVGVVNQTSRELGLHLALERLYTTGDEMELRFRMAQVWNRFYAEASKRQRAFDAASLFGMYDLGCELDFDLKDH